MFAKRLLRASLSFMRYATPASVGVYVANKLGSKDSLMTAFCEAPQTTDLIKKLEAEMRLRQRPTFSKDETTVIYVIGGPGAGKGTQCGLLMQEFPSVVHLSAGDLLRAEQARPDSALGSLIINCINNGTIVPMHVTIQLLENEMKRHPNAQAFLIDGFPRAIDQGEEFERMVCESSGVIYFECPENIMMERLLRRGKVSGRTDDNLATISKRFQTFINSSLPVVDHFRYKLYTIPCNESEEEVYQRTRKVFIDILTRKLQSQQQ